MLEVNQLTRNYGQFKAVDSVSFNMQQGEIVGLLGHNGAGKTTIMKMISGYLEPDKGDVCVDGVNLADDPEKIQLNLGYLPENLPVYPEMLVVDYLDYAADLKGLKDQLKADEIKRVIKETDISAKLLAPVSALSRGYKQRVGVAQAIMGRPKLLILDEPPMSRDPRSRSRWLWGPILVILVMFLGALALGRWADDPAGPERSTTGSAPRHEPSGTPLATEEKGSDAPFEGLDHAELEPDESIPIDRDYDIALRWDQVDLDAIREAMPDNLYWELGMPTSDPDVQAERANERRRWNEAFGRVLSGTASEAEIDAYYAQRYRLSTDYLEFASHLLENYADVLPERDVGLLGLVVEMHHARLQQMPRRVAEAHERKKRQDRLREAWLEDEAAFRDSIGAAAEPEASSDQ